MVDLDSRIWVAGKGGSESGGGGRGGRAGVSRGGPQSRSPSVTLAALPALGLAGDVGEMPAALLRPILAACSASQLRVIENETRYASNVCSM